VRDSRETTRKFGGATKECSSAQHL
jgi:hypothetical protein